MMEHLRVINPQACADQYGEAHCAPLPRQETRAGHTFTMLITPAALAKRLSEAWAAGFTRAAEAASQDVEALHEQNDKLKAQIHFNEQRQAEAEEETTA